MTSLASSESEPLATPAFRSDIQGLRAVAVVLVVLAHASVPGMGGGFIGVDVFFVISGFVITRLLHRQPPRQVWRNLGVFYARRVRRILPAATLTMVATVLVAWWLLGANFPDTLLGDVRWSSLFGANFRLIKTSSDYFIPGIAPSLVTHFWSLAVEEQFYVLFPFLVFSLTWLAPRRGRTWLLGAVVVVAIATSAWWSWHSGLSTHTVSAYYSPLTRFFELALGALVALMPSLVLARARWLASLLTLVGMVALGLAVWRLQHVTNFPGLLAWWPCGATAVMLWSGGHGSKFGPARLLEFAPVRYVGDVSYSFYLFHFAWIQIPLQMVAPPVGWWWRIIEIAGAFLCAVLSYHLLENPVRRSKRLDRDGLSVALLAAVCIALSWNATLLVGYFVSK